MKKYLKVVLMVVIIFLISGCGKSYMNEISYQEYKNLIKNKETFILEVMRTDCSACISFKPKLEEVSKEYKIEIKYINTDNLSDDEVNKLFDETGISGTPTVLFYINGEEETTTARINGDVNKDKIISKMRASNFIK